MLLAAMAVNKIAFGMLLVVTFSPGLAVTLTVAGLSPCMRAPNHTPHVAASGGELSHFIGKGRTRQPATPLPSRHR